MPVKPASLAALGVSAVLLLSVGLSLANDPRPVEPEAPLPSDCCDSGCEVCVYDVYADQLEAYEQALAAWRARHPEAGV